MSVNHTCRVIYNDNEASPPIDVTVTTTGQNSVEINDSVPASTTNKQYTFAFTKTKLQSIVMYCTGVNLTLKTNSSGTPQDTITLTAGTPFVWLINSGITDPFAGDVTALFVTNADGSTAAPLKIFVNVTS